MFNEEETQKHAARLSKWAADPDAAKRDPEAQWWEFSKLSQTTTSVWKKWQTTVSHAESNAAWDTWRAAILAATSAWTKWNAHRTSEKQAEWETAFENASRIQNSWKTD